MITMTTASCRDNVKTVYIACGNTATTLDCDLNAAALTSWPKLYPQSIDTRWGGWGGVEGYHNFSHTRGCDGANLPYSLPDLGPGSDQPVPLPYLPQL